MIFKEKTFELKGKKVVLRSPMIKDAKEIIKKFKIITGETRFLNRYPDEYKITIKEKREIIRKYNNSNDSMQILAFVNGKYAGNCIFGAVKKNARKKSHIAFIGIGLLQKFSGFGLGTLMLQNIIEQVKQNGFEQITLTVASDNNRARHLYKKLGFKEFGRMPNGFKYDDGTYGDEILMIKKLS